MGNVHAHHHHHHGHHGHHGWHHPQRLPNNGHPAVIVAEALAIGAVAGGVAGSVMGRRSNGNDMRNAAIGEPFGYSGNVYSGPLPTPQVCVPPPRISGPPPMVPFVPQPAVNTPQPPMPDTLLSIARVRIPREAMIRRGPQPQGSITYFAIDVAPDGGRFAWRVMHRYSQFHALASQLGYTAMHIPDAPFPRKHWTECQGARLEERRYALEVWLQRILMYVFGRPDWSPAVRAFLTEDLRALPPDATAAAPALPPAAPPTGAAPAPAPAPDAEPASPPAAQPSSPPAAAQEPQNPSSFSLLQIQVPAGLEPGQLMAVVVPDGRQVNISVPPGTPADGTTLQLLFDPAAGTLTVHR